MNILLDLPISVSHQLTYLCVKSGLTTPDSIIAGLISEAYYKRIAHEKALSQIEDGGSGGNS